MGDRDSGIELRRTCNPDVTMCRRSHLLPLLLLFILLFFIYFNSFSGTWVFDDHHNITDNRYVHLESLDWESIEGTFYGSNGKISRPLAYLSFGINHFFHGLDEFGYHLVNFIIHCLTTLFLYLFIFRVLHLPVMKGRFADRAGSIALLATALWATSPIHVTAVTFIVQRMASMVAMFFVMAMFFYLMGRITAGMYRKIAWFGLCALSGILALATKENAVMLPVVLYLFDLLIIQGATKERLKRHLVWAGSSILFIIVMAFIFTDPLAYLTGTAYDNREFTLWERLLTQPRVLVYYLSLMLYPMTDRFALVHEVEISRSLLSPWTTMPAILFWAVWTALGVSLAKKKPLISFCLLFFVVNHVTESSFIALELIYEHRNYLPSMTLFLLFAWAIVAFLRDFSDKDLLKSLTCVFIVITVAGQGYSVIKYNRLFEQPLLLWAYNAEKAPGMSRVHTNLGKALDEIGLLEDAKKSYIKALEINRFHRHDLRAVPLHNLGVYHLQARDFNDAIHCFEKALEVDPERMKSVQGIGEALYNLGQYDEAESVLRNMLKKTGTESTDMFFGILYSKVLLKQGNYAGAINEAHGVINAGGAPVAYKVLGEAYCRIGDYETSLKYWSEYAARNPRDMETLFAIVYTAHLAGDKVKQRRAAATILYLKGDKSWNDLMEEMRDLQEKRLFVFGTDPGKVKHHIVELLKRELEQ
jgi:protein O-mannosyl-transferase